MMQTVNSITNHVSISAPYPATVKTTEDESNSSYLPVSERLRVRVNVYLPILATHALYI
jgi:hypothetical protein